MNPQYLVRPYRHSWTSTNQRPDAGVAGGSEKDQPNVNSNFYLFLVGRSRIDGFTLYSRKLLKVKNGEYKLIWVLLGDGIRMKLGSIRVLIDPIVQSVDINKSTSYARVAGGSAKDQPNVNSNFCTLVADPVFDGVNISIPRKVVEKALLFKFDPEKGLELFLRVSLLIRKFSDHSQENG
ncbi:hypothetical protein Tco_0823886 [Tanacetum coccineum]|uniref:Uncharacterized protein n=1 Tax=Tanacetum coccineum TaxID=301880 RepID=A0ABQ5ALV6_9ASTR